MNGEELDQTTRPHIALQQHLGLQYDTQAVQCRDAQCQPLMKGCNHEPRLLPPSRHGRYSWRAVG